MSDENKHEPLPVKGYPSQSPEAVALVNKLKEAEERFLRLLDSAQATNARAAMSSDDVAGTLLWCDPRCLSIARTKVQEASMWAARSVFNPKRVSLPEDVG